MLKKIAVFVLFSSLVPLASQAQVAIRIGPPPPVVEHYGPPPRPGYAWQGGYHRWDGRRYVWTQGHWGRPPRPGAVWVPGNYDRWRGGYRYHRGYWR